MGFNPSKSEIDETIFGIQDWRDNIHRELLEEMPPNIPECRAFGFNTRSFVESDHADDSITRKLRTGFLVYLNIALIYWTSNNHTSINKNTFGLYFIVMKQ